MSKYMCVMCLFFVYLGLLYTSLAALWAMAYASLGVAKFIKDI